MNPPFTRATNHEGNRSNVPNPMFAAFGSSAEDQKAMADATKRLITGTSAHGNAGEASLFLVLADRKLKDSGMLAMVMPLSLMLGESWENSRTMLANGYSELVIVSISGVDGGELSFSADTDMAECLIVGRKAKVGNNRATFVVLKRRPEFQMLGASAAVQIHRLIGTKKIRSLEDGPFGGTLLHFGNDIIGQAIEAALPTSAGWSLARIADLSLAQAAYQLTEMSRVWLPAMEESEAAPVPITTVQAVGLIGPIDRDIDGTTPTGGLRGPFVIEDTSEGSAPTYLVLWAHQASREQTILFEADCEGIPRKAVIVHKPIEGESGEERERRNKLEEGEQKERQETIDEKVASLWETASHCHFNRDFRFNSQSTGIQFTPRRTIGGRAWLSIRLASVEQEKALVLWANTSLGMLLHWWHANKQQPGRGSIGKSALQSLPILDVTELSTPRLEAAVQLFDAMSGLSLLPLHEIDKDLVRRDLDHAFARDVLGLPEKFGEAGGPLELLRMKLAREPSILGSKG